MLLHIIIELAQDYGKIKDTVLPPFPNPINHLERLVRSRIIDFVAEANANLLAQLLQIGAHRICTGLRKELIR